MKERTIHLICDCGKKIEACISKEYANRDVLTCSGCQSVWVINLRTKIT